MKPTNLTLAALAAISTFLLGASTVNGLFATEGEPLRCIVLDDLTPEELQRSMHKLVFESRSTIKTGMANLKIDGKTALTGYACGW